MPYLKNAWYAAGWANDLADAPLARTIHDQPVVIFRGEDGSPAALHDACPHRFAPLSLGKVKGDLIACGYHGLEFDRHGRCVRNPHGKGVIPNALGVRAYPLSERYGMLWIWTGEADRADPALIVDLPIMADPGFEWVHGMLTIDAHYELIIDNLLDLTHVEFLHPFFASEGNSERTRFRAEQLGDRVNAYYDASNEPVSGLMRMLWPDAPETGDLRAYMYWQAPSNLYLDTGTMAAGGDYRDGAVLPSLHLLTPDTEERTTYYWAQGRNRRRDDPEFSRMLREGTQHIFETEDEPMIRAARSRMRSNDLFAHKPALLPMDEAAVRARRVLAKKIADEQSGALEAAA